MPLHGFNEYKHPAITLWSQVFPAFVLPISISLLFLTWQAYGYYVSNETVTSPSEPEKITPSPTPMNEKNPSPPDAENQLPNPESQQPRWQRCLGFAIYFFHQVQTFQQGVILPQGVSLYKDYHLIAAGSEILSLLLACFVVGTTTRKSCGLAALAWAVWATERRLGQAARLREAVTTIAPALPLALTVGPEDKTWSSLSGIVLITLAIDPHIAADSGLRSLALVDRQLWPLGVVAVVFLMRKARDAVKYAYRSPAGFKEELRTLWKRVMAVDPREFALAVTVVLHTIGWTVMAFTSLWALLMTFNGGFGPVSDRLLRKYGNALQT
ncbi:hypothetical protein B0A50_01082 [Salinomyces thailandicus]|uniref:Transmembrane protein n=1 Tax=Salinomyces thailandicus TaxID=706561 RepID=A0A4U0UE63_9PEZI|nr:hypothetical protein B0A50_01082 [Salinomyces thailandica]